MADIYNPAKYIIGFLDNFTNLGNVANITASALREAIKNGSKPKESDCSCYYCSDNRYTGTTPFH